MEHEFKEGDTVQLKSGGPQTTIEGIWQYGMGATGDNAKCVWFEGRNLKNAVFESSATQRGLSASRLSAQGRGARLHRIGNSSPRYSRLM
jgi:uncharacterized protein YodC (DUF2158 family)